MAAKHSNDGLLVTDSDLYVQYYEEFVYLQQYLYPPPNSFVTYNLTCPANFYLVSGHCFSQDRHPD
jgi:hypothetical protein